MRNVCASGFEARDRSAPRHVSGAALSIDGSDHYRKSIDQRLRLLHILDCDVELVVRSKPGSE